MKKIILAIFVCLLSINFIQAQNSQQQADELALNYANSMNLPDNYLLYSCGFLEANSTINTIIPTQNYLSPGYDSYFYFINENPFSNWLGGHYLFINYNNNGIETMIKDYPPADSSIVSQLTFINSYNFGSPPTFNFSPSNNGCPDNNYAVIISGGASKYSNWIRYWNDCQLMYQTLRNVYNYKPENIYCLVSDGTDPSKDMRHYDNTFHNSPLDFDGNGTNDIAYPATVQSINAVFSELGNKLSEDDFLFIFTTDHGSPLSNCSGVLNLWGEEISAADFAIEVGSVNAGHIAVTMEQCFSGSFVPPICTANRTISTAAKCDEPSYAMPPDYLYDEYAFHWITAVGGIADANSDGLVTMKEAFNYAQANDTRPETPQYCSVGTLKDGDDIGLSGLQGSCVCIAGEDIHIYGEVTYSFDKNIPANIIIHDGGTLEVSSKLRFLDGKSIQVLEGGHLLVADGILTKCNDAESWQGIIAEENSSVYVTNSEILDAKFPITCKNNSLLSLEKTKIENFETALTLQDNVTISSFEGNEFTNGNRGIYAKNCTFLDLKADNSRNKFSNIDIGMYLYGCGADIEYNDFENVRIGIVPLLCWGDVFIKNNNIGYTQSGIIAHLTGGVHIEKNVIGYNNQYGDNGIKILAGKNAFVFDNEIHAIKNGIISFQNNAYISTNLLDVNGYYSDGISFSGSNGYIADNLIFGSDAEAGIDLFVGTDHWIENNEVYVMNAIPFVQSGIIKLQGPTECTVKENIMNADIFSDGLLLENSGSNTLECNEITNSHGKSINVGYNSEFQDIKTNTLTGYYDLEIKSEIGVQHDKGNEFVGGTVYALGLTDEEVDNSKFYANPDPVYANQFPDYWSPANLFEESTSTPQECKAPQGPGHINIYDDPVRLCDYFNRIKVLQTTNPKLFMVKLMHILNHLKKHNKLIPNCIKIYLPKICGLEKLSEVYIKLIGINKTDLENTLPLTMIRESISADRIDAIKGSFSEYKDYYQNEYNKERRLLDTLRSKLDSIRCPDTLIQVWKKVLVSYIDLISGDSMTTRNELTQIAKLCSYDYGEVVNLSRMMLSESDTTNYSVYDDCRKELIYRENKSEKSEEVDIYPNPTEGNITVELPSTWESGMLEIYDISGMFLEKVILENTNRIDLNLKLNNGTYLIKLNSYKGDLYIKKFVIIK